jgi:hypothetical protein
LHRQPSLDLVSEVNRTGADDVDLVSESFESFESGSESWDGSDSVECGLFLKLGEFALSFWAYSALDHYMRGYQITCWSPPSPILPEDVRVEVVPAVSGLVYSLRR